MITILSFDESTSNQIPELFHLFEKISISKCFSIYEAFLHIFVHLSIYFNFQEIDEEIISKRQEIFFTILKELILKHSLTTSFHQLTLFYIFKLNKHFLLFLCHEGVLDISFLTKKISQYENKNLFLFFIPEIKKWNSKKYEKLKNQFKLTDEDINKFYNQSEGEKEEENEFGIRRKIHSEEEIAKIIQSDDINHFIDFVSKVDNFDLNSKIQPSFFENNPDINVEEEGISLLEYSMAFGSINIFRYLWLNKVEYSTESMKYCIIGNNYEIIRIFEEEIKILFDKNCYFTCIEYYHPEIVEYFSNFNLSEEMNDLPLSSIIEIFNQTTNIEILGEIFKNKDISQISQIEKHRYFSLPKRLTMTFDINTIFAGILNLP